METTFILKNLASINEIASKILELANSNIFLFYGDLGAGKTTLIKKLCERLGVKDQISSPTYAIINEYKANNSSVIYHMDLYRLKEIEEAFEIGIEDYLYSNQYCYVEWPQIIENIIQQPHHSIHIQVLENGTRLINFK